MGSIPSRLSSPIPGAPGMVHPPGMGRSCFSFGNSDSLSPPLGSFMILVAFFQPRSSRDSRILEFHPRTSLNPQPHSQWDKSWDRGAEILGKALFHFYKALPPQKSSRNIPNSQIFRLEVQPAADPPKKTHWNAQSGIRSQHFWARSNARTCGITESSDPSWNILPWMCS